MKGNNDVKERSMGHFSAGQKRAAHAQNDAAGQKI